MAAALVSVLSRLSVTCGCTGPAPGHADKSPSNASLEHAGEALEDQPYAAGACLKQDGW